MARHLLDGVPRRRKSLYFPQEMAQDIEEEAKRLDRSVSWVMQYVWRLARDEVMALPTLKQDG
jgi:uncharacterized small protein (TIGR04563 family)